MKQDYILIKPHHFLDFLYDLAINDRHNEPNLSGNANGELCRAFMDGKLAKITSLILIIAMVMSVVPIGISGTKTEIKASVQGIRNGATYKIVSAYNGKAITQTDVSNYYANCVVWNTDAMSDLARWKVEEVGDYYTITNIVTDKTIKPYGFNNGDKLDLNGNDGSDMYQWKLVPITSGPYEGCFYMVSAVKNDNGEEEYAEIS